MKKSKLSQLYFRPIILTRAAFALPTDFKGQDWPVKLTLHALKSMTIKYLILETNCM